MQLKNKSKITKDANGREVFKYIGKNSLIEAIRKAGSKCKPLICQLISLTLWLASSEATAILKGSDSKKKQGSFRMMSPKKLLTAGPLKETPQGPMEKTVSDIISGKVSAISLEETLMKFTHSQAVQFAVGTKAERADIKSFEANNVASIESIETMTSLKRLALKEANLKEVSSDIAKLKDSLEMLILSRLPNLTSISSSGIPLLRKLQILQISSCPNVVENIPMKEIAKMDSLRKLVLSSNRPIGRIYKTSALSILVDLGSFLSIYNGIASEIEAGICF